MRRIWIIGCGGFGFQVLSLLLETTKFKKRRIHFGGFIDDRPTVDEKVNLLSRVPRRAGRNATIVPNIPDGVRLNNDRLVFGVSDPEFRRLFLEEHKLKREQFEPLYPNSPLNFGVNRGVSVLNRVRCSNDVTVGDLNFIDSGTVIGHGSVVGDNNHIGVSVIIGGGSKIGDDCIIHSGAIIGADVKIGQNCIVGAGAVVVRDLKAGSKIIAPKSVII